MFICGIRGLGDSEQRRGPVEIAMGHKPEHRDRGTSVREARHFRRLARDTSSSSSVVVVFVHDRCSFMDWGTQIILEGANHGRCH